MRSVCPHVTLCRGFRCSVFFFPSFYEACQVLTVALVHKMRVSKAAQVWNLWNSHNKPVGPWRLFNRTIYYCVSLAWKIWSLTNLFGLYGIVKIAQHIASNALLPANGIFVNVLIQMIWWCSFTTFFFLRIHGYVFSVVYRNLRPWMPSIGEAFSMARDFGTWI